jgi:hypothetical protein
VTSGVKSVEVSAWIGHESCLQRYRPGKEDWEGPEKGQGRTCLNLMFYKGIKREMGGSWRGGGGSGMLVWCYLMQDVIILIRTVQLLSSKTFSFSFLKFRPKHLLTAK